MILLALTNVAGSFRDYQIAEVAVYVVAVAGLTMLIGLSGQISIGHGAFMAVGAYVAALLIIHLNWPLILVLLVAAAATALVGVVLGVAAARLRGPYLAGATLILAVALPSLANRYAGVLGGDQGLSVNITVPSGLGASFPLTRWQAWITCATAIVTLVLLANLAASRIGRSWRAVRDDEVAAALAGLNVGAAARARVRRQCGKRRPRGRAACHHHRARRPDRRSRWRCPSGCSPPPWSAAWAAWPARYGAASCSSSCPPTPPTWRPATACRARLGSNIPIVVYGVALIVVMIAFPHGIQGGVRQLGGFVTGTRHRSADSPRHPPATGFPDGGTSASEHQEEGPV